MTYTTELLENESGIQYQGVKDKTGGTGTYPITGLMIGIFKRGRFDKPMTITNENIRAQLGYDPKNSYYVAVQDALSSGVPSVQVLRLKGEDVAPEIPTEPEITYRLTIDDKGLLPEDNIYSGTIEPPLIGAVLSFNIQQYLPNGSNGRVFNIYSDPQGLVVSPNGATWKVDKSIVAPYWDFPTTSDFITPATYSLSIDKMYGDKNVIGTSLEYIVAKPENWDIKYKVNGQWIYETTGPVVTLSTERNNAYKNLATELVFADSVESIGSSAFTYWSNLTKVTCGNSLKTIGYYAFQECSGLKIIDFGESLNLLSSYSLSNLYAIETIIFRGLTPPERENNPFGNGGSGSTLPKSIYVPDSLVQAYNEKIWDFHIEIFHPLSTYTS